jgi:hypothetical protein
MATRTGGAAANTKNVAEHVSKAEAFESCRQCELQAGGKLPEGCIKGDIDSCKEEFIENPPLCILEKIQAQDRGIEAISINTGVLNQNDTSKPNCDVQYPSHAKFSTPPGTSHTEEKIDLDEQIINAIKDNCTQNGIFRRLEGFGFSKGGVQYRLRKLEKEGFVSFHKVPNDLNRGGLGKTKAGTEQKKYYLTEKGIEKFMYHAGVAAQHEKLQMGYINVAENLDDLVCWHAVQVCADIQDLPEIEPIPEKYYNPGNWEHDGRIFSDPSGKNRFKIRRIPPKLVVLDYDRKFLETFPPDTDENQEQKFMVLAKSDLGRFAEEHKYTLKNIRFYKSPDRVPPGSEVLAKFFGKGIHRSESSQKDDSDPLKEGHIDFMGQGGKANFHAFMKGVKDLPELKNELKGFVASQICTEFSDMKQTLSEQSRIQQENQHKELMTALTSIHDDVVSLARYQEIQAENLKLRQMYSESERQRVDSLQIINNLNNKMQQMNANYEAQMKEQEEKMRQMNTNFEAQMEDMKKKFDELQKSMEPKPPEKLDPAFL